MTVPMVSHAPVNWVALHAPAAPVAGTPSTVAVGRVWGAVYPPGSPHPLLQKALLSDGGEGVARAWHFTGERASLLANGGAVTGKSTVATARPPARGARGTSAPRPAAFPSARGAFPGFGGHASAGAGHAGGHR
jgi:hypothetical protein